MRNLPHIGFEFQRLEDFQDLAEMAYRLGKAYRAGRNQYYRYTDPSGAELWTQLDENDEISGMNAHFNGQTSIEVMLLRAQSYEDRPLDGTFEAQPLKVDPGLPSDTPPPKFAFELPDAQLVPHVVLPAEATLHLVGFAREVHCFPYLEDFRKVHPTQPLQSIQVVEADLQNGRTLSSLVRLDGIVVDAKRLQNGNTKHFFYWMLLKTAIGQMDVVASSRTMPHVPAAGSIFDGQVRLSGRVTVAHPVTQKPGLVERFFLGAETNLRN